MAPPTLHNPLQSALKDALAAWASGVAVVGARDAEGDHGTTVSSFTSVSIDPPLVLVSLASSARILPPIDASGRFSVSVLAADQQGASTHLATRGRAPGFGPVPTVRLHHDLPGSILISLDVALHHTPHFVHIPMHQIDGNRQEKRACQPKAD
jgi:flavin reductase (DIM6/NTAB) family NADH-FMN oxidoreductase RutF